MKWWPKDPTRQLIAKLLLVTGGMFCFGFALVPIYNVMCQVAGINGKPDGKKYDYQATAKKVDDSRKVRIQFVASNNASMSWDFHPDVAEVDMHPGELISTAFFARNPASHREVAQAVPSISPGRAAAFFHKTECFCFTQQTLAAGQSRDMPLKFYVDPALPKDIHTITLSYTLFDVTSFDKQAQASK